MQVNVDFTNLTQALQGLEAVSKALDDRRFRQRFNRSVQDTLTTSAGDYIDLMARDNPQALHHVYEWNKIGSADPTARLFRIMWQGNQAESRAVYMFKQSTEEVPLNPNEQQYGPAEGMQGDYQLQGGGFKENAMRAREDTRTGGHVFEYKAWRFEDGATVTIKPTNAKMLAIPWHGHIYFAPQVTITYPEQNRGAFAAVWNEFWLHVAEREVEQRYGVPQRQVMQTKLPQLLSQRKMTVGGLVNQLRRGKTGVYITGVTGIQLNPKLRPQSIQRMLAASWRERIKRGYE